MDNMVPDDRYTLYKLLIGNTYARLIEAEKRKEPGLGLSLPEVAGLLDYIAALKAGLMPFVAAASRPDALYNPYNLLPYSPETCVSLPIAVSAYHAATDLTIA